MEIYVHNTATRQKEQFRPLDPENVRMYVCGPTVYDRAHLGNSRPVLVFDVLNRLLRHVYPQVTYVRNFTDVDDRINETAQKRKAAGAAGTLEDLIRERSGETIAWYHADMDALGALRPDHEPRATDFIGQMVDMIAQLEADGFAYAKEGHVLFRVRKYSDYGQLSGRSVDDMIAGARVEVAPFKEDPMDFVLWKPSDDALPGWDSPWGRGRPGWHIECSAMAHALLGDRFDIHGGGNDLQFPHHENEIAQSRCAGHGFANVWMHNEMLQVEGKKMSKSLGNFFTVRDLLEQGVPGEVIRFVMLSTHYRKPIDWTEKKRDEADAILDEMAQNLKLSMDRARGSVVASGEVPIGIVTALCNDLDTHSALGSLRSAGTLAKSVAAGDVAEEVEGAALRQFLGGLQLLGFYDAVIKRQAQKSSYENVLQRVEEKFDVAYELAKQMKDFSKVDALKEQLAAAGVEVRMSKSGVELVPGASFDPTKLEALT